MRDKINEAKTAPSNSITYAAIPDINVSELGWSFQKQLDTGEVVPSEQRAQLIQFLENIQGSSLSEKLQNIESFLRKTPEELKSDMSIGETSPERISNIISYLVFYKTLTTIITNFNAASAGFSFESFLAVLLGGAQISAAGATTIADLHTKEGIPLSLKLYSELSVDVGGSFTALAKDIVEPQNPSYPFMRYIVAIKSFTSKGFEAEGVIRVYQFDIDLDNFGDIMANTSISSKESFRIVQNFIDTNGSADFSDQKRKKKAELSEEDIDKVFTDILRTKIQLRDEEDVVNSILTILKDSSNENMYNTKDGFGKSPMNKIYATRGSLSNALSLGLQRLDEAKAAKEPKPKKEKVPKVPSEMDNLAAAVYNSYTELLKQLPKLAREVSGPSLSYASTQDSLAFYNNADDQTKKKALLNTKGFLETLDFSMSRIDVEKILTGNLGTRQRLKTMKRAEPIGTLTIGKKSIEGFLKTVAQVINVSVFDIFSNLKELMTNINSYFATGLKEDALATNAQTAAKNIDRKTEKVKRDVAKGFTEKERGYFGGPQPAQEPYLRESKQLHTLVDNMIEEALRSDTDVLLAKPKADTKRNLESMVDDMILEFMRKK